MMNEKRHCNILFLYFEYMFNVHEMQKIRRDLTKKPDKNLKFLSGACKMVLTVVLIVVVFGICLLANDSAIRSKKNFEVGLAAFQLNFILGSAFAK